VAPSGNGLPSLIVERRNTCIACASVVSPRVDMFIKPLPKGEGNGASFERFPA
jgi:hypothetical protein